MGIGKYNKVGPKQDVCLAACEDQVSFLQLTTEAEFINVHNFVEVAGHNLESSHI
jgi:hypothetical protein